MAADHDAYGTIARFYDRVLEPMNKPLRSIGLKMYPATPGMRVLDVGCGTGAHLEAYVDAGADGTGIDLSPAMLEVAQERLGDRATLELCDATNMPYADGTFDLVFTSLFLHELDAGVRSGILVEMRRVMREDGRMLVIDYGVGPLDWKGRGWRAFSTVTERLAGSTHYANWRRYLDRGGVGAMLPEGVTVENEKVVAGGNLTFWLLAAG